jgi:hypothetical protein
MFATLQRNHARPRPASRFAALRHAVEIGMVIAALVLMGLLRSTPFFAPAPDDGCDHLGRAGEICPQPNPREQARRARESACIYFGRAGRHCPEGEP